MTETTSSDIKKSKSHKILRSIPFLACLPDEEFTELERIVIEKHFHKNNVILLEEDTPNFMYVVYSGKVKVVRISSDGKEQIVAIHKKGDFFGEMAILDGKTRSATVIAMEDVHVGLIHRNDFERLLNNPKVLREIISILCSRLRGSLLMLKVLSFADAEQRIQAILTHLSTQYGVKDQRGILINARLTHKDIAGYASLSRETVTRILDRFVKAGEIEFLDNKYILLKPSFLEKMLVL
jgi:CRP/FNR family transcriptional regulator